MGKHYCYRGYRGGFWVSIDDHVRPIPSGEKFSHTIVTFMFIISTPVKVLSMTLSPSWKTISWPCDLLEYATWIVLGWNKLSFMWATSSVSRFIMFSAVEPAKHKLSGSDVGTMGRITWGDRPRCNWKPEYTVKELTVFIMQKWIQGRAQI